MSKATEKGTQHRDRMARRSRQIQASVAEVGDLRPVKNPYRRSISERHLVHFLCTYFPHSTGLKRFSDDHIKVIRRIEQCALAGGKFVEAIYRGFAKSTILENSMIWVLLYGHRQFGVLFAVNKELAEEGIDSIKMELAENELIAEDFPEVCQPVEALEGKVQRCASQTVDGRRTMIEWTADSITLPTVYVPETWGRPDIEHDWSNVVPSAASGAVLKVKPYGARGLRHKRPDGKQVRPDFVGIDDPQTDDSAASPHQVSKKLSTLKKSILRLGGHHGAMPVIIAATIIQQGDMIDRLLDPKLNPSWQGERIKMLKTWSDHHEDLWLGKYADIRNTFNADDIEDQRRAKRDATRFYEENRKAMDAGCEVSWPECYSEEDGEISAIQHAYNILIDDGLEAFMSECQNEPVAPDEAPADALHSKDIASKINGYARRAVPVIADRVTAHIDVQQDALYYLVAGWGEGMAGGVMDYGAFPDQSKPYFTYSDIKKTLRWAAKDNGIKAGIEAALTWGLVSLLDQLFGQTYTREDGSTAPLDLVLVDVGYKSHVVREAIRQSKHRDRVMPAIGRGIGAKDKPMHEWPKKRGGRRGIGWDSPPASKHDSRHVLVDVNAWKTIVAERLRTPIGDHGALSIYGQGGARHQMLAENLCAEYGILTEGRQRTVEEWTNRPNRDNHLWDTLVGSAVAASMVGVRLIRGEKADSIKPKRKKRLKLSSLVAGRP